MDEDDCASSIKLGPDGFKVLVSQVFAAVGGIEAYTLALKLIKDVIDLCNGACGVNETRYSAELAEEGGWRDANIVNVIVNLAR